MPAKYKFFLPIFFFLFFIFAPEVSAQVVINEIEPYTEWVELYKTQEGEVSLEGCVIYFHNSISTYQKKEFGPEDKFLGQVSFKKVDTNNTWLANDGDTVILDCNWGQDTLSYGQGAMVGKPPTSKSVGRYSDGSNNLFVLDAPTPGGPNSYTQPTPTPSPTPTPTQSPSSTPTPTPTPTKTPTSTPKPTVKAVVTKKPKVISTKKTSDEEDSEILGLREGLEPPSPTPIPESEEKRKIPITAVLFVLGGLGFIGIAGYPFLKSMKKRYNIKNEEETGAEGGFKSGDN